jgi:aminopeptidase N
MTMITRRLSAAVVAWLLLVTPAALAGEEVGETCLAGKLERAEFAAAFDEATGRDLRNYPPDRIVDYLHMTLDMRFEDIEQRNFTATQTLRFAPIGNPADSISLDAVDLDIESVTLDGEAVEHYSDGKELTLRFDPPLAAGRPREVVIEYACDNPTAGMIFTPSASDVSHYTAEVHTQGQTVTNRHWFPCFDHPNERLTTELIIDVPSGYAASGNGRLVSNSDDGHRAVWHYLQDKPHVNYLVAMVIGKYDIVEIPHARVPMQVWVPQGQGDLVMGSYGRTGEMIDMFEQRLGIAYPWDRYDQLLVKNFGAGGMENTTATTMYPTAVLDEAALADGDLESLIAHELAHQWTGDMITCKSWTHIWLNEGWATYGSALWFEHRDGEDGYLDSMRGNYRRLAWRDKTTNDHGMVSPVWEHAWENFRRGAYPKGASVLHMLRAMLGDDVFFEGVAVYMNRHALGTVETNDFRYAMEEVSGLGLEWFFDQWCVRPGIPKLDITVRYDAVDRRLTVDVAQTQHIDERTPAFRFVLPIYVQTANGPETFELDVRDTSSSLQRELSGPPQFVAIDPWLHVLASIEVDKPLAMWIQQVTDGPTIAARRAAIGGLAEFDTPETIRLLAALIDDASLRHTVRSSAVSTLAKYGSEQARDALLAAIAGGIDNARVRAGAVGKLDGYDAEQVTDLLAEIAGGDASYATRVAAIKVLAELEATEHADLIVELVGFPSQHEQVRNAALAALAKLDDPRGLDLGIQYAAFGYMDRARPKAIAAVGKLAEHDTDRAVPFLIALLDDPEPRSVQAAGKALADIGDERAIDPIKAMSESDKSERRREMAEKWLKKLEKKDKDD